MSDQPIQSMQIMHIDSLGNTFATLLGVLGMVSCSPLSVI